MANYIELYELQNNSELRNRVIAATVVAAYALLGGTPNKDDRAWFSVVVANPKGEGIKAFHAVLAANAGLSVTDIKNASDSAILNEVVSIRPVLVQALAGV